MSDNPTVAQKSDIQVDDANTLQQTRETSVENVASEQEKERSIEDVCDDMLKKVYEYFDGDLTGQYHLKLISKSSKIQHL